MARARNIKPGFLKNETLCELPPLARILFAGLWMLADREGRLEDRPRRIKAECLPYDDCETNDLLWNLHDKGFIVRYTVSGKYFISIPKFKQHQKPHQNESPSELPDISAGFITSRLGTKSLAPRSEALGPDSLNPDCLNTDSQNTTPPTPPSGGPSPEKSTASKSTKARRAKRSIAQLERALGSVRLGWWKDFWSVYPCHEDKRAAMDAFERVVVTAEVWAKVRAGAVRYRAKAEANPDLCLKYGQGWINGERWEDEESGVQARASPRVHPGALTAQEQALLRAKKRQEETGGY